MPSISEFQTGGFTQGQSQKTQTGPLWGDPTFHSVELGSLKTVWKEMEFKRGKKILVKEREWESMVSFLSVIPVLSMSFNLPTVKLKSLFWFT